MLPLCPFISAYIKRVWFPLITTVLHPAHFKLTMSCHTLPPSNPSLTRSSPKRILVPQGRARGPEKIQSKAHRPNDWNPITFSYVEDIGASGLFMWELLRNRSLQLPSRLRDPNDEPFADVVSSQKSIKLANHSTSSSQLSANQHPFPALHRASMTPLPLLRNRRRVLRQTCTHRSPGRGRLSCQGMKELEGLKAQAAQQRAPSPNL